MSTRMTIDDCLDAALESPELAPFAMFNVDLTSTVDPTTGELMFPELAATSRGPVWLWDIRSNKGLGRTEQATKDGEDVRRCRETLRQRILLYSLRVKHKRPLYGETQPPDEWERFWCGPSPTESGYVPGSPFQHNSHPTSGTQRWSADNHD